MHAANTRRSHVVGDVVVHTASAPSGLRAGKWVSIACPEGLVLALRHARVAHGVEGAVLRPCHEPGAPALRHARGRPLSSAPRAPSCASSSATGVAHDAGEAGHQPGGLASSTPR